MAPSNPDTPRGEFVFQAPGRTFPEQASPGAEQLLHAPAPSSKSSIAFQPPKAGLPASAFYGSTSRYPDRPLRSGKGGSARERGPAPVTVNSKTRST